MKFEMKNILFMMDFLGETGVPKSLKTIYDLMNQTKMKSEEKLLEKRKGAYHHEKMSRLKGPKDP